MKSIPHCKQCQKEGLFSEGFEYAGQPEPELNPKHYHRFYRCPNGHNWSTLE